MRSLDERIAEINRRGRNIIACRKKRWKQALAVCTPIILCVCVIAAAVWPERSMYESYAPEETNCADTAVGAQAGGAMAGCFAEITGPGMHIIHSEEASVLEIIGIIDIAFTSGVDGNAETAYGTTDEGIPEYTIRIQQTDGNTQSYLLRGNCLVNADNGMECNLSDTELEDMLSVLGIGN